MNSLDGLLEEFEYFLKAKAPQIPSFHPHYEEALWEMLCNGGKRFRPRLLFSAILNFSPDLFLEYKDSIFTAALAIETLHTYSLIHDDLPCMDNASLRRSHPTLHVKYNETLAVLVGDALNTHAFWLLTQTTFNEKLKNELVAELAYNAGTKGMVLGQALDCFFENTPLSLQDLEFLHIHKTGMLIAASLKMGALIAMLDMKICDKIYALGLQLGLMFQIYDDMIDATQDCVKAGKTTQNDASKNSYVNLLGLESSKNRLDTLKQEVLKEAQKTSSLMYDLFAKIIFYYF